MCVSEVYKVLYEFCPQSQICPESQMDFHALIFVRLQFECSFLDKGPRTGRQIALVSGESVQACCVPVIYTIRTMVPLIPVFRIAKQAVGPMQSFLTLSACKLLKHKCNQKFILFTNLM